MCPNIDRINNTYCEAEITVQVIYKTTENKYSQYRSRTGHPWDVAELFRSIHESVGQAAEAATLGDSVTWRPRGPACRTSEALSRHRAVWIKMHPIIGPCYRHLRHALACKMGFQIGKRSMSIHNG